MIVYPLFASNVVQLQFKEYELMEDLNEMLINREFLHYQENGRNQSAASLSKRVLDERPYIKEKILSYFVDINSNLFHYPPKFEISTSWFTRMTKDSYSPFHTHRNSFFSGVLYFGEYSDQHAPIEFNSPIVELSRHYIIPQEYNIHNSDLWKIYPQKGSLLFFPSYLQHRIGSHYDDVERYSLAFNIVPVGEYGDGDSTYSTEWFK